jgi:uncharacterized protein YndB with AHSA1/START domain
MKINYSVQICNQPEVVFAWLSSPERARVWMESVSHTEILHQTDEMTGTTFRETVEEDGNQLEMEGVITNFVQNQCIAFHLKSRIHALEVEYRIEGDVDGVRLIAASDIHWKFPMNIISLFIGSKMKQNILSQMEREFSKLKTLCES